MSHHDTSDPSDLNDINIDPDISPESERDVDPESERVQQEAAEHAASEPTDHADRTDRTDRTGGDDKSLQDHHNPETEEDTASGGPAD